MNKTINSLADFFKTGHLVTCIITAFLLLLLDLTGSFAAAGEADQGGFKDLAWRSINFIILAGLLYYLLAGRIKHFFTQRRESIEKLILEARAARDLAEIKHKEVSDKLARAEEEIRKLTELIISQGMKERDKLVAEATETAARLKDDVEARMEQELEGAKAQLRAEAVAISIELAQDILKRELTSKDHDGLVRDYLDKAAPKR